MTTHSERSVRTRMRERGIKPNVANMERVMADLKAGERHGGTVPGRMGAPDSREVAAKRAAAIQAHLRRHGGGAPI